MIANLPLGAWVALIVTVCLAVVDWGAVRAEIRGLEIFAKPATLLGLIAMTLVLALTPGATVSQTETWIFVAALVFCLGGDVLLMVLRENIIPGLVSFLLGHVLYVVGINTLALSPWVSAVAAVVVVAGIAFVVCATVFDWFRGIKERPALVAYMVVIGLMVASAWTLPWREGVPLGSAIAGMVGASLFFFSDSMIAYSRFMKPFENSHFWIMVTYHLGQIGLVLSLVA